MLRDKIRIRHLPVDGAESDERRLFSPKGELAQIVNGSMTIKHLVYWDLDSPKSGQTRGDHYHHIKNEECYILTGELDITICDRGTMEQAILPATAGDRITIEAGVAHSYRSRSYAQVLELLPTPYDATDTVPFKLKTL